MFKAQTQRRDAASRSGGRFQILPILLALVVCLLSFGVQAQQSAPGTDDNRSAGTSTAVSAPTAAAPANANSSTGAPAAAPAPSQAEPAPAAAANPPPPRSSPSADGTVFVAPLPDALSPISMFMQADIVVKAVMIGLALASVATWTVLLVKIIQLRAARREARGALATILSARSLADAVRQIGQQNGPTARLLAVADDEIEKSRGLPPDGIKERVAWQFERIEAAAVHRIGRGMGILATVGAVAPFVGLFGTVWGIMNSFIGISRAHTTNLAVVAPGIAEALLATAFGLVAAIPAVVIYNAFARATGSYRSALADSSVGILRLLSRDLDRQSLPLESRRPLRAADAPALSIANPAE
jgi:biopolymer transport protein ExbB